MSCRSIYYVKLDNTRGARVARRSFCVVDVRKSCQNVKTHLQNGSGIRQFCEDRPFSSREHFVEKRVFLTVRVLHAVPDKTQKLTVV